MTRLSGWRTTGSGRGVLDRCSLVIATYNRHAEVFRLLEALLGIPERPAEVVIVDGDPSRALGTELAEWLDAHAAPFDCAYVESPPGLTRQRNVGVDVSTRQYVFFLDDDAVPLAGYFREMARVFDEDRGGRIGGIAGCVINEMERPLAGRWKLRFALGIVPRIEPMIYYPSGTHVPDDLLPVGHPRAAERVEAVFGRAED